MSDIGEEIILWLHLDDDVSKERDWPHYVLVVNYKINH